MGKTTLVIRYTAFAVIATLANLAAQRVVLALGGLAADRLADGGLADGGPADGAAAGAEPLVFAAAVAVGTLVGLVIKYILDKRWIFADVGTGLADHGRKFTLYTAMGVVTTAIFWGTETLAWAIWGTDLMREAGAVLGLMIGYIVKYRLDRRFVFTDARLAHG